MESFDQKKRRARKIVSLLQREYPDSKTALHFSSPFQLLVATILSAQCTDARVNEVTPVLFQKYPTARDMAHANLNDVEDIIHPTGFYRMKAKNIIASAKRILEEFNGEVPQDMLSLLQLPGVGRKTANCVLGAVYGRADGVVVDTHVLRLAYRMGLTTSIDPKTVEKHLMELLPRTQWYTFSNILINHGRSVCRARNPQCLKCIINDLCPKNSYTKRRNRL